MDLKYLPPINLSRNYKSQYGQDYYLKKFGLIAKSWFLLEVGCNHLVLNSNSSYLEKCVVWKGIYIDVIGFTNLYSKYRKKTIFVHSLIDKNIEESFYQVRDEDVWEN